MRIQAAVTPTPISETAVVLPTRAVRLEMPGAEINCRRGFRTLAQSAMLGRNPDEEQGCGGTAKELTYTERMAVAVRRWMVKKIATILTTVGFATAACGGIVFDQDSDTEQDADVAADVEPDNGPDVEEADGSAEDVSSEEDAVAPDDGTTEDVAPETEEDGGVEDVEDVVDASDVEEVPEVVDIPDAEEADATDATEVEEDSVESVDGTDGETETDGGCTPTVTTAPSSVLTGPETICGSLMTTTVMTQTTTWEGPDCEFVGPERVMMSKTAEFSPYLDISDLSCARTRTIRALNGDEVIVGMTPTSLESATAVVPCMSMWMGGPAMDGGGPLEYDATIWNVLPTYVILEIFPPSGPSVRVNAYPTGVAVVSGSRGYIVTDINEGASRARVCYIMLPTTNRTNPYDETWTAGDWWTYPWNTAVVGSLLHGWEWVR